MNVPNSPFPETSKPSRKSAAPKNAPILSMVEIESKVSSLEAGLEKLGKLARSMEQERNDLLSSIEFGDQELFEISRYNSHLLVERSNLMAKIRELEGHLNHKVEEIEARDIEIARLNRLVAAGNYLPTEPERGH